MTLPRVIGRSLLAKASIAILLILVDAQAADDIVDKAALFGTNTARLDFTPVNLGFGNVSVGRRRARTLTPSPSSLNFGSVQIGNRQQLSETVTNAGDVNISISQATVAGTGFNMTPWAPVVLTPGQHYTFTVTFAPPSTGNLSGNVSIVSNASNPNLSIPLSGTGTPVPQGQLSVSPTTLAFGNVIVGANGQLNGTLGATGQTVIVSSDNAIGSAFAVTGLSFPVTIPAGQHAQFTVTFTPSGTGAASGSVSFTSNASNSPTVEDFTGTGAPPPQNSVNLSWTASTSTNLIGYNIYRGLKSGGPYSKINSVLDASTLYTDTTVADGTTYYYVTTSVDSSNVESGYSNQTTAVIPPP
jgi:Abnormal spindle-like microcephaly-assoc'd, ASPM-SPD-2-Hydin